MNDHEQRELDAWIAEHVMGWVHLRPCTESPSCVAGFDAINDPFPHERGESYPPSYTTDPAAAMEVLKKIQNDGYTIAMTQHGIERFEISKTNLQGVPHFTVVGKTLELAIALCAKKIFTK